MTIEVKVKEQEKFSLAVALECANEEQFAYWLDEFLRGPGNNVPLANGLKKAQRWWVKPRQLALNLLTYRCGPGLEYHEDKESWNRRVVNLVSAIENGVKVPPLIAEFKNNQLELADGNHRCGALQYLKETHYWTAIWFNTEEEYQRYYVESSLLK